MAQRRRPGCVRACRRGAGGGGGTTPWTGIDIAVADPSRHGYLSNNQRYFKKAAAAGRYVHKKQTNYNRLLNQFSVRYPVEYTPLGFEVTGGASGGAWQCRFGQAMRAPELK